MMIRDHIKSAGVSDFDSDLRSIDSFVVTSPFEFFCRLLVSSSFDEDGETILSGRRFRFPRRLRRCGCTFRAARRYVSYDTLDFDIRTHPQVPVFESVFFEFSLVLFEGIYVNLSSIIETMIEILARARTPRTEMIRPSQHTLATSRIFSVNQL